MLLLIFSTLPQHMIDKIKNEIIGGNQSGTLSSIEGGYVGFIDKGERFGDITLSTCFQTSRLPTVRHALRKHLHSSMAVPSIPPVIGGING